jgi:hypothetical protein
MVYTWYTVYHLNDCARLTPDMQAEVAAAALLIRSALQLLYLVS